MALSEEQLRQLIVKCVEDTLDRLDHSDIELALGELLDARKEIGRLRHDLAVTKGEADAYYSLSELLKTKNRRLRAIPDEVREYHGPIPEPPASARDYYEGIHEALDEVKQRMEGE